MNDFEAELGNETWQVKFVTKKANKGNWGMCNRDTKTITIYNKLEGVELVDTLIHEMRHAQHPIPYEAEEFINQTSTELAEGLDLAGLKMSHTREKTKGSK